MIIFSEEKNLEIDSIENEITYIKSILENEKSLKKLLVSYMNLISNAVNNMTNPIDINAVHKCLENLKLNLDNVNSLISSITDLLNTLNNIKDNIDKLKILDYNCSYTETFDRYLQINNEVYSFINGLLQYTCIIFPEETVNEEIIYDQTKNNEKENVDNLSNLKENTLIISEKNQNVVLPYTISELKDYAGEYQSLQDIVEKYYTRPLSLYKNAPLSRFKEALNLIKEKEKGSLKQALDLGLELFFNSNLHPAIISACKNLDELDIYLDYLENGETHKFSCFDIVFDVAPVVVKNKRS